MLKRESRFRTRWRICTLILLILIALSGILGGCASIAASASPTTGITAQSTPTEPSSIPIIPITAVDYGYEMPNTINVRAGLVDFAMVNNGTQPHQTQIARLHTGVTANQVLNEFVTRHDQVVAFSLLTLVGGPDIVSPGYGQEAILNLSAGQYVLLCLVVGSDGVPHVNKG
ncbi:MAG TPA: hypothetical protein VKR06_42915, partial [Ktedonosporobacter sp.]|nr:hypothetical protein [Ktedonosporobacter sp.]